jgi:hypothetical protein
MSAQQPPETHWIVELEEDPETGDLVMPLPPAMLEALGWNIGDDLTWNINDETKEVSLTKSVNEKSDQGVVYTSK